MYKNNSLSRWAFVSTAKLVTAVLLASTVIPANVALAYGGGYGDEYTYGPTPHPGCAGRGSGSRPYVIHIPPSTCSNRAYVGTLTCDEFGNGEFNGGVIIELPNGRC